MLRCDSSQNDRKASLILRVSVRSFERNRFFANCWVRVEPPCTTPDERALTVSARPRPIGIDAPMVVEAAVLGRKHGLHDIIGILVERHGVVVENAAPPDLLAEAVLEGDGEIGLFQPVARGGEPERGLRQHDHDEAAEHAQRQALAGEFDHDARGAAHVEPLHEAGEIAPQLAGFDAQRIERGIDPGIEAEQAVAQGAEPSGFAKIIGQGG